MRPWRGGLILGIAGIILASLVAAVSTVRAVCRQLDAASLRSALVASISHDLRTPLTAMLLQLEILDDDRLDDAARKEQIARARQSARRLRHLVERVLDYQRAGRVDAADLTLEDPADLVHTAASEMKPLLSARTVHTEATRRTTSIRVERDAMIQVLVSLIENALRHTPPDAPIRLAVEEHRGRVGLVVADRGPGVPETERARLTEPFYRSARAGSREGTGLGLAIARKVVERDGGRLTVTATAPGEENEGLRVTAELPRARPSPE